MTLFQYPIRRFRRRGIKPTVDLTGGSIPKPLRRELDRLIGTGLDPLSRKVCKTIWLRFVTVDDFPSYSNPKWIHFCNYALGISRRNHQEKLCK